MAKVDFSPYAMVIPAGESLSMTDYFNALREASLVPSRWLDAKHAGVIQLSRDAQTGLVVVSAGTPAPEGNG